MSDNGGTPYPAGEPTSYGLQPPNPPADGVRQQGHGGHAPGQGAYPPPPGPPQPGYGYPGAPQSAPQPPQQPAAAQQAYAPTASSPYQQPAQPVPAQPDPGAGRLIAGRYRLLSKLGHGGMGTVWRAKDETVDREVAVKEPRVPEHLPERERVLAYERMRREARAAAKLDHPAVVSVHDVAVEDDKPWIVMEFVQGRSLGDALREGTLGAREAARVGLEVLGALQAAHQAGVLHRDVKPDNVMLGRHDRVVLTDFGIAQIEGDTNLTETGNFVGSPEFVAPERVLGQRPGPASDLWSLGVVLYAATEGVSPFRRSNTPATLQSVLNATPTPPAAASGPLAQVISGLLSKDPAHRPGPEQVRQLLDQTANPAPPPQIVRVQGPGGKGISLGRKAWGGIGAALVAAAVVVALLVTDPFAGPLPDGWKNADAKSLQATLAVPDGYVRSVPDPTDDDEWVRYTDPSGALSMTLSVERKKHDTLGTDIAGSANAQAYADAETFEKSGEVDLGIGSDSKAQFTTEKSDHQGKEAAINEGTFVDNSDSDFPRPRKLRVFYFRTQAGDMYRLAISYPGKGDLTERGDEVAGIAIDNLRITEL